VSDFFYGHIVVDAVPWLTSKDIKDIIPMERPLKIRGIYDLQIVLTKHGREQWEKLLNADSDKNFAVLVDGTFYQSFQPRRMYKRGSDSVVIDGPFSDVIAKLLHKRAPFNYLKLNDMDKDLLKFRQSIALPNDKTKPADAKPSVKKQDAKAESKPSVKKPDVKAEPKKQDTKAEPKPSAKTEEKPAPQPDGKDAKKGNASPVGKTKNTPPKEENLFDKFFRSLF